MTRLLSGVALWLAALIPLMPKIMIAQGVYMYAYDVFMVCAFIPILFFIPRVFFFSTASLSLSLFWAVIFIASLLWGQGGITLC